MKKEGQTFSKRFEKKFITDKISLSEYMSKYKDGLGEQFSRDHFLSSSEYTIIKNIYFDDENLSSYHDSVLKKEMRRKIRARTYAENGVPNNLIFFEIKTKIDGQTTKGRVALKKSWYNDFVFNGKIPLNEVIELNHHIKKEKVIKTVDTLSDYIHNKNYRPMLINEYRRQAYKLNLGGG